MEIMIIALILSLLGAVWGVFKILCLSGKLGRRLQFTFGHNHKYSTEWDTKVLEALKTSKVKYFDSYVITFENGIKVWIKNKDYGYSTEHAGIVKYRTSWRTAKGLMKLEKDLFGGCDD